MTNMHVLSVHPLQEQLIKLFTRAHAVVMHCSRVDWLALGHQCNWFSCCVQVQNLALSVSLSRG